MALSKIKKIKKKIHCVNCGEKIKGNENQHFVECVICIKILREKIYKIIYIN